MQFRVQHLKNVQGIIDKNKGIWIILLLPLSVPFVHAENSQNYFNNIKSRLGKLIAPEPTRSAQTIDISSLYSLDTSKVAELPQITRPQQRQSSIRPINADIPAKMSLIEAVHTAVQCRSEIAQSISS